MVEVECANVVAPATDLENALRGAKEWLNDRMITGYKPTRDQAELARLVDFAVIRDRKMRSFQHLESALCGLLAAIRDGNHKVIPTPD